MSRVEVDQFIVGKHLKFKADGVRFDVHAGTDYIGAWLSGPVSGDNDLGLFMRKGESPAIMLWASKELGFKLPFAFGGNGLQIPVVGGAVVIPLAEISRLAKLWQETQV